MEIIKLKQLKQGEIFTKKSLDFPNDTQVWVRDYYDRESKKYICYNWADINKWCAISGDKLVYIGFTF